MKDSKRIFAAALIGLVCAGTAAARDRGGDRGGGYGPCHDNYGRRHDGFDRRGGDYGPRREGFDWRGGGYGSRRDAAGETVAVSGNLELVDGQIAVVADGVTYIAGGLRWLTGFIEGIKEGAAVSLEGWARTTPFNANTRFLRISKLTVGGKDYTFPAR
ncbi:MAG: hypothetical protein LBK63_05920 [Treponema sp.]|jgi:hypothetical protein|nr:hypothetical protein [Treponema sp.]